MNDPIRRLLDAIDAELTPLARPGEGLDLYHLGRSALIFHYGAQGVSTEDVDVIWMRSSALEDQARELFGKGTARAQAIGLYLDFVPQALPPVPARFKERSQRLHGPWQVIRLWELEPHDYAATKLKSFRPQDRQDVQFLCDAGFLRADELRASLESAFLWDLDKDGDEHRDRAFANLGQVTEYLAGTRSSV